MNYLNEDQGFTTGTVESVAVRILKEQAKLGKLQSLNLSVRSVSEQKRKRMIQAGVLGVALLTAGGFLARGAKRNIEQYKKSEAERKERFAAQQRELEASERERDAAWKELDQKKKDFSRGFEARRAYADEVMKQINGNDDSLKRVRNEMDDYVKSYKSKGENKKSKAPKSDNHAELKRQGKELDDLSKDLDDLLGSTKSKGKNKKSKGSKFDIDAELKRQSKELDDLLKSESWNPVEEAFFEKKLTIYVEAKYKYGTKVFEVFSATPEAIKSSRIDKKIFNEVKTSVNRMKNNGFSVREDLTLEAYKEIKLGTSLLEDFNFLL